MDKNLQSSVIVKVAAIILLSFDPFIGTVFPPFGANVLLDRYSGWIRIRVRILKEFDLD